MTQTTVIPDIVREAAYVLDADPMGTVVDFKRAFYRAANRHHPDRSSGGGDQNNAARFCACRIARDLLVAFHDGKDLTALTAELIAAKAQVAVTTRVRVGAVAARGWVFTAFQIRAYKPEPSLSGRHFDVII